MTDEITIERDVDEVLGMAQTTDVPSEGDAEASTGEPEDDEDEGSQDESDAEDDED